MKMKNKLLQDGLNPKDTLKGYVYIYKDGKLVVEGHNLIVNSGRQFVKDIFTESAFALNVDEEENSVKYNNYKFYKVYFGQTGKNNFVTAPTTTYEDVENGKIDALTKNLAIIGASTENTVIVSSDIINRKLIFEVEINGISGETYSISEIFLTIKEYLKDENRFVDTDTEVLFSRFVFDPIFLSTNSNCKIIYYVSF